ncbi:SIS domain-containing protein [Alphaproteobacteria bacterium]|nr:SIS domain-containing protein [Alphaproteobacteria bacterium]
MTFPNTNTIDLTDFIAGYMEEIQKGFDSIDVAKLEKVVNVLDSTIRRKGTIYTCGNGGSSSIAEHFVCDFLKGASTGSSIQPIIHSLCSNTSTIMAVANDISYDEIFSFQLERYGKDGDVLLCVSSSGNSKNILKALSMAKSKNIKTISFVGFSGGDAKDISDNCIHIPIKNYGIVEDIHHSLMHLLAQYIRLKNLQDIQNIERTVF